MPNINRDMTVREYWRQRLFLHHSETYRGLPLVKLPEDLRCYERVIDETRPTAIVELGTYGGGSARWFSDRLRTIVGKHAMVVTVDVEPVKATFAKEEHITALHGDLADREIRDMVAALVDGHRVMVIDDSAHTYATTSAALNGYSDLVSSGCYFVVEDGIVDEDDLNIWNAVGGVRLAISDFLPTDRGSRFEVVDWQPYGITMHMGGWLYAAR